MASANGVCSSKAQECRSSSAQFCCAYYATRRNRRTGRSSRNKRSCIFVICSCVDCVGISSKVQRTKNVCNNRCDITQCHSQAHYERLAMITTTLKLATRRRQTAQREWNQLGDNKPFNGENEYY
jgi:hypothetical protein